LPVASARQATQDVAVGDYSHDLPVVDHHEMMKVPVRDQINCILEIVTRTQTDDFPRHDIANASRSLTRIGVIAGGGTMEIDFIILFHSDAPSFSPAIRRSNDAS